MNTQTPIRLKIEDAAIGFDQESPLLESVDLEIRAGEIVGLTGSQVLGRRLY